jgi:hypothetical protein
MHLRDTRAASPMAFDLQILQRNCHSSSEAMGRFG